ncbi:O-antigen ligase family protein [Clostridium cadaveris]|uniref:O-antigen ligase family protein n=1 Tax=Clostridium cadaveris TaxID=1529 RepID=UPI00227D7238|nr:O-antigen ligase family protein [Clostridium cadaveris]
MLPFIYSLDNLILKSIGIICILFSVLISMKRTAFIATIISLLIYVFMEKRKKDSKYSSKIRKIPIILAVLIMFFIVYNYTLDLGFNVFSRVASIKSDGGSNRFIIFRLVNISILKNNIFETLWGNGYNAVALMTGGLSAHNDFLEIFYDFGIVGFIFYIFMYFILIRYAVTFKRKNYKYSAAFSSSIYILLCVSLSSHLIFIPTYIAFLGLFWGLCIYDYENRTLNIEETI